MQTYIIKSACDLKPFKQDDVYHITGHAQVECTLDFTGSLLVDGRLSIEAGWYIKAGWSIEAGGSIKAGGSIEAGWYIKAGGSIEAGEYIKAGGSIEAGGSIKAGGSIEAGGSIKAGGSIEAGGSIKAGGYIRAGESIKAGGSIEAGGSIFSLTFEISCEYFVTKKLPFWRSYWSAKPPMKKWRKEILDENLCWNAYKTGITKKEAREICKWDGWHWILKGQLEMFFGLKDKCVPPKKG